MAGKARRARLVRLGSGCGKGGPWSPDDAADEREAPGALLEADDKRRDLGRRFGKLDDGERAILALRFGLEGELPLTYKEVGRRLGVTRGWVRKIEIRAVRKLDDREGDEVPGREDGVGGAGWRSDRESYGRIVR